LVLISPKINTVKIFTLCQILDIGTRKNGLKYSVLGKIWYSVQPYKSQRPIQRTKVDLSHYNFPIIFYSSRLWCRRFIRLRQERAADNVSTEYLQKARARSNARTLTKRDTADNTVHRENEDILESHF